MLKYWLKALGSAADPLPDAWRSRATGVLVNHATFAKRPMVEKGDQIVYYAAGTGQIFAAGVVTSHPYQERKDSPGWPWRVNVKLEVAVDWIHDGAKLELLNDPTSRNDVRNRIKRRSHVQLSEREYERAVAALRDEPPGHIKEKRRLG
jgi:hypothetical protein